MPTYTYPGVYVEELPSSVRSIIGVGTSITAFIGRAIKGPTNKATTIHSYADYTRIFGGLWKKSNMSYAVYQYFQNGGVDAIIVRVTNNAKPATFTLKSEALTNIKTIIDALKTVNTNFPAAQDKAAKELAVKPVVTFIKDNAGGLRKAEKLIDKIVDESIRGDVKKLVQSEVYDAFEDVLVDAVKAIKDLPADSANKVTGAIIGTTGNKFKKIDKEIASNTDDILSKLSDDAALWVAANKDKVKGIIKDVVTELITEAVTEIKISKIKFKVANEGIWGEKLDIEISDADKAKIKEDGDSTYFDLTVYQKGASDDDPKSLLETFRNVSLDKESPRFISKLLAKGVSTYIEMNYEDKDLPDKLPYGKLTVVLDDNSASDGDELDGGEVEGNDEGKTGMYALKDADLFNLLCIPAYNKAEDKRKDAVYPAALAFCNARRAILIVDPPATEPNPWKSADDVLENFSAYIAKDKNGAIFFPRIKAPDPLEEYRLKEFDPCGVVAGVIARTDAQRGVWKAPAGIEAVLAGVPDLAVRLTNEQNGMLNPKGVNCLRILPDVGRVIWGSRTLRGADGLADQWKYLSVRRTALYIEETLFRGTQWVVFEPNDERLWAQIRLNIKAFMHSLFVKGAFQGTDPNKAYLVKCDSETTTQTDIDAGIVNILVGFAPLKPAEFVVLKIQQLAGQELE